MIILIRGHIRNGFDTDDLYHCLRHLHAIDPLTIYIHTWDIKQNSISWRLMSDDSTTVTPELIHTYFRELTPLIKHIRIDPDRSIPLIGDISGIVAKSMIPKIGWKSMWAGIHTMLEHISAERAPTELVVNTRFDVFSNSNNFKQTDMINLYRTALVSRAMDKFWFFRPYLFNGCDNYYISSLAKMSKLASRFHTELDRIIASNSHCECPERMVMIESMRI